MHSSGDTVDVRIRRVWALLFVVLGLSALLVSVLLPWYYILEAHHPRESVTAFDRLNPVSNGLLLMALGIWVIPPRSAAQHLVGATIAAYGFGAIWGAARMYDAGIEGADATIGPGVLPATLGWVTLWLAVLVGWPPRWWPSVAAFLRRLQQESG